MRLLFPLAVLAAAQIGAAWASGDANVARPGGAFSTVEAETAQACERLCADDGLCMAWSWRDNLCELKAIVPAAVPQEGTVSGVSPRAPASLRASRPPPQQADQAPAAEASAVPPEAETLSILAATEDEISSLLLGGPEDGDSLSFRN